MICGECVKAYPTNTFLGVSIAEITAKFDADVAAGIIKMTPEQIEAWEIRKATRGKPVERVCGAKNAGTTFENTDCINLSAFKPREKN